MSASPWFADSPLTVHPDYDNDVTRSMFTQVLGVYPQAPSLLHEPDPSEVEGPFESIRQIMQAVGGLEYAPWRCDGAGVVLSAEYMKLRRWPTSRCRRTAASRLR